MKLYNDWKSVLKDKNQTKESALKKRSLFETKMNKLIDVANKDAIDLILTDRLRLKEAGDQDVEFLNDQRNERLMFMSSEDKVYHGTVQRKLKRLADTLRLKTKTCSVTSTQNNNVLENYNEEENDEVEENDEEEDNDEEEKNDDNTDNFVFKAKTPKKSSHVLLSVLCKLAAKFAVTAARCGASTNTQSMILANTINASGGNVEDFSLSGRASREAVMKKADEIRERFRNDLGMKYLTVHFDGKKLHELTQNILLTVECMAVLVSSLYLPSGPELLSVPAILNSSGAKQEKEILA